MPSFLWSLFFIVSLYIRQLTTGHLLPRAAAAYPGQQVVAYFVSLRNSRPYVIYGALTLWLTYHKGQTPGTGRLRGYCDAQSADIFIISFVYIFRDPPTSFFRLNVANSCAAETDPTTGVYKSCPNIGPDIKYCQSLGKKVFLALGGANGNVDLGSIAAARSFASQLANTFLTLSPGYTGPRPFLDAVVDGFDFDIETQNANSPAIYKALITDLRAYGARFISWAPQCIDYYLTSSVLEAVGGQIDYLFLQYYNNPPCQPASMPNDFLGSFQGWMNRWSQNANKKLFLGLPGSSVAAGSGYVSLAKAGENLALLANSLGANMAYVGGVSIWDANYAFQNKICGVDYAKWMKLILTGDQAVAASNYGTINCPVQLGQKQSTSLPPSSLLTHSSSSGIFSSPTIISPSSLMKSSSASSILGKFSSTPSFQPSIISQSGSAGSLSAFSPYTGSRSQSIPAASSLSSAAFTGPKSQSTPAAPSVSSTAPSPNVPITQDGQCGARVGRACTPGDCCSLYGWCGRGDLWCGSGCNSQYGTCNI